MKAFDSITHASIWNALKSCGIEHDYISLLKKLYRDQKATVLSDEENDICSRSRKEPNRATLCQACSSTRFCKKHCKKTIHVGKRKKGMGIYLSDNDHDCFTNMRFADDVLLFATSKEQLQKMVREVKRSIEKVGLRIHPGKTKILATKARTPEKKLRLIKVVILTRGESTKYSGQMITFQQQETTEIRNRIRAAWARFHKQRRELTIRALVERCAPCDSLRQCPFVPDSQVEASPVFHLCAARHLSFPVARLHAVHCLDMLVLGHSYDQTEGLASSSFGPLSVNTLENVLANFAFHGTRCSLACITHASAVSSSPSRPPCRHHRQPASSRKQLHCRQGQGHTKRVTAAVATSALLGRKGQLLSAQYATYDPGGQTSAIVLSIAKSTEQFSVLLTFCCAKSSWHDLHAAFHVAKLLHVVLRISLGLLCDSLSLIFSFPSPLNFPPAVVPLSFAFVFAIRSAPSCIGPGRASKPVSLHGAASGSAFVERAVSPRRIVVVDCLGFATSKAET